MINLETERRMKHISQQKLAEKVGISRQAISQIERGITQPSVTNAKAIAEVLGLNWYDFFK